MSDQDEFEAEIDGFPTHENEDALKTRLPVEVLASQFVDHLRAGGSPTVDEYARQHPDLADEIREYFPMLLAMERWKSDKESEVLKHQFPREFDIDRLGGCKIEREVARGGMGVVFEATQRGKRVAVKLLPWRVSGVPKWRERFEQEARTAANLRHRHIVPIKSFGQYDGYCYYVMNFVDGVSLDHVIERLRETDGVVYADEIRHKQSIRDTDGTTFSFSDAAPPAPEPVETVAGPARRITRSSWKTFAKIGLQAAQALGHAHAHGTLHNDVKPGNLLLDANGRVWMTDFGLARPVDPDDESRDDRLTGTLRYMAPERFTGHTDERSDIYSLGMTLYELLTLTPAFEAKNSEDLVRLITTSDPERPREQNPDIPRPLEAIVLKATAYDAAGRYQTANDIAADLTRFIGGARVEAPADSRIRRMIQRLTGRGKRKSGG